MRDQLRVCGVGDTAVDDAVLILSELLSNACRHGRPLRDAPGEGGDVLAAWRVDTGRLTVEVTDGGGPTRPVPAKPSVTAHGGRGLHIITALADDWGVRDDAHGEVTVWVVVRLDTKPAPARTDGPTRVNGHGPSPEADPQNHLPAPQSRVSGHGSDTAGRTTAVAGGTGRRTGSGAATAVHTLRPGRGQSPRYAGDRTARTASRPMTALPARDFTEPFDDQD
jgi:anti-sigma regulatory factor (Ser/Thr protein kinase)